MSQFQTRDAFSDAARANIAADLALQFSEIARKTPAERFSLTRVLNAMSKQEFLRGSSNEAKLCEAAAIAQGSTFHAQSATIPWAVLAGKRDLTIGTNSAGGYLAGSKVAGAEDVLRPYSLTTRLGVTILENLTTNMLVPTLSSSTTGQWLATESTAITANQGVINVLSAKPKTAGAMIRASRQFMIQGANSHAFIRDQLLSAMGEMLDFAVLQGTGASGQPTGLLTAAGVNAQSGAVTFANQLDALETLANGNVNEEAIKFVMSPALRRTLQERPAVAGNAFMMVMEGKSAADFKPVYATPHCPAGTIFVGDWSQCLVSLWGSGVQIEVDPYTSFTTGAVQVRVLMFADVSFMKPTAFVRHTSAT